MLKVPPKAKPQGIVGTWAVSGKQIPPVKPIAGVVGKEAAAAARVRAESAKGAFPPPAAAAQTPLATLRPPPSAAATQPSAAAMQTSALALPTPASAAQPSPDGDACVGCGKPETFRCVTCDKTPFCTDCMTNHLRNDCPRPEVPIITSAPKLRELAERVLGAPDAAAPAEGAASASGVDRPEHQDPVVSDELPEDAHVIADTLLEIAVANDIETASASMQGAIRDLAVAASEVIRGMSQGQEQPPPTGAAAGSEAAPGSKSAQPGVASDDEDDSYPTAPAMPPLPGAPVMVLELSLIHI